MNINEHQGTLKNIKRGKHLAGAIIIKEITSPATSQVDQKCPPQIIDFLISSDFIFNKSITWDNSKRFFSSEVI